MEGVDYSFSRPNLSQLVDNDKKFVGRYVGNKSSEKNLTRTEAQQIKSSGMDLFSAYEASAGWMVKGSDGAAAAMRAHEDAVSCGMPASRPVYFCCDVDPANFGPTEWLNLKRCLAGAADYFGGTDRVGLYGAYSVIHQLVPEFAMYGWQTRAWSHGQWSRRSRVNQHQIDVPMAGGLVDLNTAVSPDFGQWSYKPEQPPIPHGDEDMAFMVTGPSGATLCITGNAALLVTSEQNKQNHLKAGIPNVPCDQNQFSRYEKMRIDTASVEQTEV